MAGSPQYQMLKVDSLCEQGLRKCFTSLSFQESSSFAITSQNKEMSSVVNTKSRSGPPVIGGDKTGADIRKIRSSLRNKNLFLCALASKQSSRLDGKRIDIEF